MRSKHHRANSFVLGLALGAVFMAGTVVAAADRDLPSVVPVDLPGRSVPFTGDSGLLGGPGDVPTPVWEMVAGSEGATWIRVFFGSETRLSPGSTIRITSMYDGAVQDLDARALSQWGSSSAYFNGSQVLVELVAQSPRRNNRVVLDGLWAGIAFGPVETICGATDDRVLSSDPRAARMLSGGCTGWLINECFLSAGHCMTINTVVQFNVPLSSAGGSLNHPPPSEQYTIDTASRQWVNATIGNDWGYFGAFPNTQTGLTPLAAQGSRYIVASNVPKVTGQSIRITGYGVDSTPSEYNQVQQTEAGPFQEHTGTIVRYEVDTTGGNSGSAVVDESTGRAIGIHTNAGCDSAPPPYNQGTGIDNASLQQALRNPTGVCAAQPACNDNGVCDVGEDCFNCVADCGHAPPGGGGGGGPVCGNNICEIGDGEDCSCSDCNSKLNGNPANRYCCGSDADCSDPRCTGNGNTCNPDPTTGGNTGYCCGDGTCEGAEDETNCGVDCATICVTNGDCDDFNDCTDDVCNSGTCSNTPFPDNTACGAGGICCGASCSTAACSVDGDCDDADVCTDDYCLGGGTCATACDNVPVGGPACCVPTHNKEKGPRCSDGLDNDCDGLIDGADPDC